MKLIPVLTALIALGLVANACGSSPETAGPDGNNGWGANGSGATGGGGNDLAGGASGSGASYRIAAITQMVSG